MKRSRRGGLDAVPTPRLDPPAPVAPRPAFAIASACPAGAQNGGVSSSRPFHTPLIASSAIAAIATVLTVAMPLLEGDTLGKRMRAVSIERDRIRAREREKLNSKQTKPALRQDSTAMIKSLVDSFNLSKWLGTEQAKLQLAQAGYRGKRAEDTFLVGRLAGPVVLFVLLVFYLFIVAPFDQPATVLLAVAEVATCQPTPPTADAAKKAGAVDPRYASPRATVRTFLAAINSTEEDPDRLDDAVACLDLSKTPDAEQLGGRYAFELEIILRALNTPTWAMARPTPMAPATRQGPAICRAAIQRGSLGRSAGATGAERRGGAACWVKAAGLKGLGR